jgi:hypothetical protein
MPGRLRMALTTQMATTEDAFRMAIEARNKFLAIIAAENLQRQRVALLRSLGASVSEKLVQTMTELRDIEVHLIKTLEEDDA